MLTDLCSNDAEKTVAGQCGCGELRTDTDSDVVELEMMRFATPHIGVEPCAWPKTDVMGLPCGGTFFDEVDPPPYSLALAIARTLMVGGRGFWVTVS